MIIEMKNDKNKAIINATLFILLLSLGLYVSIFQSIINIITTSYNSNSIFVGMFVSIHFVGCILGSMVVGEIGDRLGSKKAISISIFLFIMGVLLILISREALLTCIGIFIIGFGINGIDCTVSGTITFINKGKEIKMMNLSHAMFCLGTVIGPVAAYLYVTEQNWRGIYLPVLIVFLLMFVLLTRLDFQKTMKKTYTKNQRIISLKLIKKPDFLTLCLAMFLYLGIEAGTTYWLNSYMIEKFDSKNVGMLLLAVFWGSMMIGRFIVGYFHKKETSFLFIGLAFSVVATTIWPFLDNMILIWICLALIGMSYAPLFAAIMSRATVRNPQNSNTAAGTVATIGCLGGAIVPFSMGLIAQVLTIRAAFFSIPILLAVLLLTLILDVRVNEPKACYKIKNDTELDY